MGSGRDKRKKAKPAKPGQGAIKTERKNEKRAAKDARRQAKKERAGEGDIDALLAKFKLSDGATASVQVIERAKPPSARVYASVGIDLDRRSAAPRLSHNSHSRYALARSCPCLLPTKR